MKPDIRRTYAFLEEKRVEASQAAQVPLRRAAVVVVLKNPHVSKFVQDLSPMIESSVEIGALMASTLKQAFGEHEIQSYGKGGIVGVLGEQEHANAMLTTAFADPIRRMIGQADAWISSFTKVGAPGCTIDVPMNHKDDVYVRSHYDGMTITVPGTPEPDEIALIFCVANRGRLNARVGGLTHEQVVGRSKK
jgi:hypothetical protein